MGGREIGGRLPQSRPAIAPVDRSLDRARVVLVADDDPAAVAAMASLLEQELQAFSMRATNVADALRWLEKVRPAAAVLSLRLAGGGGMAVAEHIRHDPDLADVPVIGIGDASERRGALAAGCAAFVTRPLERASLVAALWRAVAGWEPHRGG
jgi:CheY-like chemotaxis protein